MVFLIPRSEIGLIIKSFDHFKTFGGKAISTIVRPIMNILGYLLLKSPALKGIYNKVKIGKVILSSPIAFGSIRLIARFYYWALIISNAIPHISIDQKEVLSGIDRIQLGAKDKKRIRC